MWFDQNTLESGVGPEKYNTAYVYLEYNWHLFTNVQTGKQISFDYALLARSTKLKQATENYNTLVKLHA